MPPPPEGGASTEGPAGDRAQLLRPLQRQEHRPAHRPCAEGGRPGSAQGPPSPELSKPVVDPRPMQFIDSIRLRAACCAKCSLLPKSHSQLTCRLPDSQTTRRGPVIQRLSAVSNEVQGSAWRRPHPTTAVSHLAIRPSGHRPPPPAANLSGPAGARGASVLPPPRRPEDDVRRQRRGVNLLPPDRPAPPHPPSCSPAISRSPTPLPTTEGPLSAVNETAPISSAALSLL